MFCRSFVATTLRLAAVAVLTLCWASPTAWADGPSASAAWSLTTDGSHVLQHSTRMLWPRCVEGMRWTGRDCAGQPLWLDQTQAQTLARQRSQAGGQPRRLPHVGELQQFARQARAVSGGGRPGIPEAAQGWVWSGTVPVQIQEVNAYAYDNVVRNANGQDTSQLKFLHGWVVNTATGESRNDVLKRTPMMVLLVRRAD